jgi:hypothetical protein
MSACAHGAIKCAKTGIPARLQQLQDWPEQHADVRWLVARVALS